MQLSPRSTVGERYNKSEGPMDSRTKKLLFIAATVIVVVVAGFFFFVQDYASTSEVIVEEPYIRTGDTPPSGVDDQTSHPELTDDAAD